MVNITAVVKQLDGCRCRYGGRPQLVLTVFNGLETPINRGSNRDRKPQQIWELTGIRNIYK